VKPAGDWQDPDARLELLAEVARDAERALRAVEEDDELAAVAAIAEAARLCARSSARSSRSKTTRSRARVVGAAGARSSPPTTPRCATAAGPPARRFTGYKRHAAAAAEAPVLTAITLSPANEHDGHHAGAHVDQQPERRLPKRLIGDTAYGNVEAEGMYRRAVAGDVFPRP
jgi:Transposase DDE domain